MMREITTTTTLYNFDELSEEAQERAIEDRQYFMVSVSDSFNQEIEDAILHALAEALQSPEWDAYGNADFPGIRGLKIDAWDLHSMTIVLDGTLTRDNAPALPWPNDCWGARVGSTNRAWTGNYFDLLLLDEETGAPTYPELVANRNRTDVAAFKDALGDAMRHAITVGRSEYEYLIGEELAREWCEEAGEVFTRDGELYG